MIGTEVSSDDWTLGVGAILLVKRNRYGMGKGEHLYKNKWTFVQRGS